MSVYQIISAARKKNKKLFSVLIDPDKLSGKKLLSVAEICDKAKADFVFAGSSLLTKNNLDSCIRTIRKKYSGPVVLFPGNTLQVSRQADAILFLSLISG